MKQCTKCKIFRLKTEYNKNKTTEDGLQKHCNFCRIEYRNNNKQKIAENNKKHYLLNSEKLKEKATKWNTINVSKRKLITQKNRYKTRYGITVEQKQSLVDKQGGKCAICFKLVKTAHDTCVDHCHKTNVIRGILCRKCNLGIGHLNDSLTILKSALRYIKRYSQE